MKFSSKTRGAPSTDARPSLPMHAWNLNNMARDRGVSECPQGGCKMRSAAVVNGKEYEQCIRCGRVHVTTLAP